MSKKNKRCILLPILFVSKVKLAPFLSDISIVVMEKEAEHLLAGEGGSQAEHHFANYSPYRRRSWFRNIPWLALLGAMLFTVFVLSVTMLSLKTVLGYEIVIRPLTLAKDVDIMMYCKSSATKCSFLVTYSIVAPLHYPLQYETTVPSPRGWETSIYFGEPSEESELAWNRMLHRECLNQRRTRRCGLVCLHVQQLE